MKITEKLILLKSKYGDDLEITDSLDLLGELDEEEVFPDEFVILIYKKGDWQVSLINGEFYDCDLSIKKNYLTLTGKERSREESKTITFIDKVDENILKGISDFEQLVDSGGFPEYEILTTSCLDTHKEDFLEEIFPMSNVMFNRIKDYGHVNLITIDMGYEKRFRLDCEEGSMYFSYYRVEGNIEWRMNDEIIFLRNDVFKADKYDSIFLHYWKKFKQIGGSYEK